MIQKDYPLDQIDCQILSMMQKNARISNADIARELQMAPSAILQRVKKLEQKHIILQYTTRINPSALEQNLLTYVFIKCSDGVGSTETAAALASIPEVQEVHHISGEDCYLVKIRTVDSAALLTLLRLTIGKIPTVISTRTTIVLETIKEQQQLTIPQ